MIASFYPPGESLQLIIARSMGKAVTFHTPHTHTILLLKEDSNCLVISETLHREQGENSSAPSDRPKCYHRATRQCVCVCVCVCSLPSTPTLYRSSEEQHSAWLEGVEEGLQRTRMGLCGMAVQTQQAACCLVHHHHAHNTCRGACICGVVERHLRIES